MNERTTDAARTIPYEDTYPTVVAVPPIRWRSYPCGFGYYAYESPPHLEWWNGYEWVEVPRVCE